MMTKWMKRLENLILNIASMQIPVYAANACYFLAMSIFPGLLLILASLRFTPLSATDLILLLEKVLPSALMGAAEGLIVSTYYNSSGAVLGISAVTALWSASKGVHALIAGMNSVYGVKEERGWVVTRLLSVGFTFVFLLVLIVTLVFQVFGQPLADRFWSNRLPVVQFLIGLVDWQSIWLLAIQILIFALIYKTLPNRYNPFVRCLPGAAIAALGWQAFSAVFSFYVEIMLSRYTNIYGSVYTMAIGLLWAYSCMCILLFGGVLNRLLQPRNRN